MPDAISNTVPIVKVRYAQAFVLTRSRKEFIVLDQEIGARRFTDHGLIVQVEIGDFPLSSGPDALHAACIPSRAHGAP
jgi:hypothetical protein